ncbi:MAG: rod shape-determining protein MreC [Clostridiales Family XIII bacterium]|jgi:rod shape-determining protein MreC|nr:rod shape-determining protein MreC [Clostridiales Family XIII bacterium]
MKWFWERPKFTIAAAAIVLLLIFIFASWRLSEYDNPAGGAARSVISAVQKPFAAAAVWVRERVTNAFTDEDILRENEELKEKVSRLQDELIKYRLDETELEELRNLQDALGTDALRGEYTLKAANVLAFEGSDMFNILTIDVGEEAGAGRDTVVVNGDGLIGRVFETAKGSSKVVAIIDENNKIGFQLADNPGFLGVCSGDGDGGLTGVMLDDEAKVKEGDQLITSGIGGVYPAGIVIGTVIEAKHTDENALLAVKIQPAVYFKGIKKVALLL